MVAESAQLAEKCENLADDEQRIQYLRQIDADTELYCPVLIILARDLSNKHYRQELYEFLVSKLSDERSRYTRKTCTFALKTYFMPATSDDLVREFFVLFETLEEHQHLITPVMSSLNTIAYAIAEQTNDDLKWQHLRAAYLLALRNSNGWIRAQTIDCALRLPPSLIENDLEFIIDKFYTALGEYDLYWRFNELGGINALLEKLRAFTSQFQTLEFYERFLNLFIKKPWIPATLFFNSYALPQKPAQVLNNSHLPLFRHVFATIENMQYKLLKLNLYFNFAQFIARATNEVSLATLSDHLPSVVVERLHAAGNIKYGQAAASTKLSQTPPPSHWSEIFNEKQPSDANLVRITKLLSVETAVLPDAGRIIQLMPKINQTWQCRLLSALSTTLSDIHGTNAYLPLIGVYTSSIIEVNKCDEQIARLEELLDAAEHNLRIAFVVARVFNEQHVLSPKLRVILAKLAVFSSIPSKLQEVIRLAHSIADKFCLDQIYEYDKLAKRTREMAICSLLRQCRSDGAADIVRFLISECQCSMSKFKSRTFGLSFGHRLLTRHLTLLLVIFGNATLYAQLSAEVKIVFDEFYANTRRLQLIDDVCDLAFAIVIDDAQQHSIRIPAEWILSLRCRRDPTFFLQWQNRAEEMATNRMGSVVSWMSTLVRATDASIDAETLRRVLTKILPFSSVQNFSVRAMAVASIRVLYAAHSTLIDTTPALAFVQAIACFDLDVSGNSQKVLKKICVDPLMTSIGAQNTDLHTVFYVLPRLCGLPDDELLFAASPEDANLVLDGFVAKNPPQIDYSTASIFSGRSSVSTTTTAECVDTTATAGAHIQQKLNMLEQQSRADTNRTASKQLIVVASLVEKPANLGGICRTCEVFGVTELIIADLRLLDDKMFQALSTTAENWLTINEVKPSDLPAYLNERRKQHFTIVAAEQTTQSQPFESYAFDKRTILLLGEERQGIPADLLRFVNPVEIKQLGYIRSLNVHVTAALFIYAFARQHLL